MGFATGPEGLSACKADSDDQQGGVIVEDDVQLAPQDVEVQEELAEEGEAEEELVLEDMYLQETDDMTRRLLKRLSAKKSQEHSIEKRDLIDTLEQRIQEKKAFCSLPFSILFFLIFVFGMLEHENIPDGGLAQRELRSMLEGTTFEGIQYTSGHKDINDIDTWTDIYTFLGEVVLPLFINPAGTPEHEKYRVLRYNQLLGGVQIQIVRRKKEPCNEVYPDLGPFEGGINPMLSNFYCYPHWTRTDGCFGPGANESIRSSIPMGFCPDGKEPRLQRDYDPTANASPRRLSFVPDGSGTGDGSKGEGEVQDEEMYSVLFHEHGGLQAALDHLAYLSNNGWVDYHTSWLGVNILVLNPDLGVFVDVTVNIYMAVSGALLPHVVSQAFAVEPYAAGHLVVVDGIWFVCLLLLMAKTVRSFRGALKNKRVCQWIRPNLTDVITVVGGFTITALWLSLIGTINSLKEKCMDVRLNAPDAFNSAEGYNRLVWELHKEAHITGVAVEYWKFSLFVYTLILAMRFLAAFDAQPRLAVVTKTISAAMSDLFHFLVVMVIVFLSFTVAGHFLFGRRIWDFSSLSRSMFTCARIFLGDFDWDELSEDYTQTARLWFFLYIMLMTLLMLNMVMAIIMEQYTETKSDASETAPLWTTVWRMAVQRWAIHKGITISDAEVIEALQALPEDGEDGDFGRKDEMQKALGLSEEEINKIKTSKKDANVDVPLLKQCVGNHLSDGQAMELIRSAEERVEQLINKGVNIAEAMKMIGWVKIATQKIGWRLDEVLEGERRERDLMMGKAMQGDGEEDEGITEANTLLGDPGQRVNHIEERMKKVEDFLHQAMEYAVFRGNDLRNRLAIIEDLIRSSRDAQLQMYEKQMWGSQAAQNTKLGSKATHT